MDDKINPKNSEKKRGRPKGQPTRIYTETDKATALAACEANKGNVADTARRLGMPEITLRSWWNKRDSADTPKSVKELNREARSTIEKRARALLNMILESTTEDVINKARLGERYSAGKILFEISQTLAGDPSTIQRVLTMTPEQKLTNLIQLAELIEERRNNVKLLPKPSRYIEVIDNGPVDQRADQKTEGETPADPDGTGRILQRVEDNSLPLGEGRPPSEFRPPGSPGKTEQDRAAPQPD